MTDFQEQTAPHLKAPVTVVIGCGDMGISCARALGNRSPLLLVDIDPDRLEGAVTALAHEGYTVQGFACDITSPGDVAALGAQVRDGPGVRTLAHVAAIGDTPGGWRAVMNVDLVGPHLVTAALAPYMVAGGAAILISSTGSYQCPVNARLEALIDAPLESRFLDDLVEVLGHEPDFLEAYFIAKQGVNRLARRLALDWGHRGVRVVSVSPGLINSTMGRTGGKALPVYDGSAKQAPGSRSEKATKEVPLGRQGSLLEVTAVIEFLASDAASFVSGIDIPIDGGSTALWRSRGVISR